MNAGSDTQVQVMTVSAGGDGAKGVAATLRGQQHCEVTSPSHCQPRLKSIGHVEKINDFTIKPLHQYTFLLISLNRHTSIRLSNDSISCQGGTLYRRCDANAVPI
jgi:hypothetical protein